jgi:uncharacterized protein (UPF0210 family)
MKIRAITTGVTLTQHNREPLIRRAAQFNHRAQKQFEQHGYEVQTTRISTQPWEEYVQKSSSRAIIKGMQSLEQLCLDKGIRFTSVGTTRDHAFMKTAPRIIRGTKTISASIWIADAKHGIDHVAINHAASAFQAISKTTVQGSGNFRFAAIASCPSDIPFFPAGFHQGPMCFSIALECSDLLVRAFSASRTIEKARTSLFQLMTSELQKIEKICMNLVKRAKIRFKGIDTSPAPSLKPKESIVYAFEKLRVEKFGSSGTLGIAAMITDVLKALPVKRCGYSGLMLPVLEDHGLAQLYGKGKLDVQTLLTFSAVSGTGLDCVPLPGAITRSKLCAMLYDVAALSIKLKKPLSARLFPVTGKKTGDMTAFQSPYLVDCRIPPTQ